MICKILIVSKIQIICSNILNVYRTKEPSSFVVDDHDMHAPLGSMGLTSIPLWAQRPRLPPRPPPQSFFCPYWSSFAIWTNSSSTNVASINCGDDATSGTIGGVDDTSIGVIGVSSTGGGLMSIDGASLRTNVCLVPFVWAPSPLVHTPLDRVMNDIGC